MSVKGHGNMQPGSVNLLRTNLPMSTRTL